MELYQRRIIIERVIKSIDTDGDGNLDSIAFVNDTDFYLPFLLRETYDDIGVYTDYDDTRDVIEIEADTLWNDYNDGSDDGGEDPVVDGGISNPYVEGEVTNSSSGTILLEGCTDPNAVNYNPAANTPCEGDNSCCDYGFGGASGSGGGSQGSGGSLGSCHRLSSGWISSNWSSFVSNAAQLSIDWCKGTASSCGNAYPISNNCSGNACNGGSTCCPGPVNSHRLFGTDGTGCESGQPCGGSACCQQELFEGIRLVSTQYNSNDGTYYHTWHFYCYPN
jgi:hypothetical protein